MKVKLLFNLGHPAHVHLYKHLIWELTNRGHEIKITARDKEILLYLLDCYGFNYTVISNVGKNLLGIGEEMLIRDYRLFKIAKDFNPDIMMAVLDPPITHIGKLLRIPSITFTDTEHAKLANIMTLPFTNAISTPSCFRKDLGKKQIRYNGYHELAYLHPNYFAPNPAVLDEIGLSKNDTYIILRFVSWDASHDVGQHGIQDRTALVRELERYGQVFITSEGGLDGGLAKYQIKVSPEKMHDLLYYASLYVGEGGTTASEAATLGTHAIHTSTTAKYCGIFDDLNEYGLMWISDDETGATDKAAELLQKNNIRREGARKRERLLKDKIDVTAFMVWFVENYPESFGTMKENPEYQNKFGSRLFL